MIRWRPFQLRSRARDLARIAGFAGSLVLLVAALGSTANALDAAWSPQSVEQRRQAAIAWQVELPFSKADCYRNKAPGGNAPGTHGCLWGRIGYALALIDLGRDAAEIANGNDVLTEAINHLNVSLSHRNRRSIGPEVRDPPGYKFHFLTSGLLSRIYFMFGDRPDRLTEKNKSAILDQFWDYAKGECKAADAVPENAWRLWYTENISLMRNTTCWAAAEMLAKNPVCGACTYEDGSTPTVQRSAWSAFMKELIAKRATEGWFVEIYSQNYFKYTLQNFYNMADFASDARLRRSASNLLDVWWAEWAQCQVDGRYGGARARTSPFSIGRNPLASALGWLYFGLDAETKPKARVRMPNSIRSPAMLMIATSQYQPPALVGELAIDLHDRGDFEARSRNRGLLARPIQSAYNDIAEGGIARYSYVTPSFVMSTSLVGQYASDKWAPYSSQNRWSGLLMSGDSNHYVFARPLFQTKSAHSYNDTWGVQDKATQIIQKLAAPLSHNVSQMAVWIGANQSVERDGEWLFVDSTAYVAVRPAFGGLASGSESGQPIKLNDETSPVIIQAAKKEQYPTLADFKAAILKAPLAVDDGAVHFTGLDGAKPLTFYFKSGRLPEIDGKPVDLAPPYAFDSPYIQAWWGSGIVTLHKGDQNVTYDFRP